MTVFGGSVVWWTLFGGLVVWWFGGSVVQQPNNPFTKQPRFTYHCEANRLANLYWTVSRLTDAESEHRKYWQQNFGLTDADKDALERMNQVLQRLRARYRPWENETIATPFVDGPMAGLFIAPMSSFEQRVLVGIATADDLGSARGRLPDLSFSEINTIVGTCAHFAGKFDSIWTKVADVQVRRAAAIDKLLKQHDKAIEQFISRAAKFYGAGDTFDARLSKSSNVTAFQVHFLWSPRDSGGQCTLVENHLFCEASDNEDPQRFLLGVLHESCHYLSAIASSQAKHRRTETLLQDGVYYPITLIEEALATSLAQGIAGKAMAPTLFKKDSLWVGHFNGKVDAVARAILPTVQSVYDANQSLDVKRTREIGDICRTTLVPRPRDYTAASLVTGRKELRDYFRKGISQGSGLRFGEEFPTLRSGQVDQSEPKELPPWLNRVYLIAASEELADGTPLAVNWSLPIARSEFDRVRAAEDRFIFTRKIGSRYEFILYAENDAALRSVIDRFKQMTRLTEGVTSL